MDELVKAWLADASDRLGWSLGTVRTYRSFLTNLFAWLEKRNDARPGPEDYTAAILQTYDTFRKRAGKAQRTRAVELSAQQSFARFLRGRGAITQEALTAIEGLRVKVTEKPRKVWASPEQVQALFAACGRVADNHSELLEYRARLATAVLAVMAYGGLRRGEVCGLRLDDVHLDAQPPKLVVRHGKGDKTRDVWLAPECVRLLREWIEQRPTADPQLFAVPVHHVGHTAVAPLTAPRVVGILRELAKLSRVPLKVPLTCHAFRRFAATQLLKIPGCSLAHVQEFLGHRYLQTTLLYIGTDTSELQQLVRQFEVEKPPALRVVDGTRKPTGPRKAAYRRHAG